jgi:hypothetical protein
MSSEVMMKNDFLMTGERVRRLSRRYISRRLQLMEKGNAILIIMS